MGKIWSLGPFHINWLRAMPARLVNGGTNVSLIEGGYEIANDDSPRIWYFGIGRLTFMFAHRSALDRRKPAVKMAKVLEFRRK